MAGDDSFCVIDPRVFADKSWEEICGLAENACCVMATDTPAQDPPKPPESGTRPNKFKQAKESEGKKWMKRLAAKGGEEDAPTPPMTQFIPAKGEKEIVENPRLGEAYKVMCTDACGLTPVTDATRYGHVNKDEIEIIKTVVRRSTS